MTAEEGKLRFNVYACSDQGRIRSNNEDNFYISGTIRQNVDQPHMECSGCFEGRRFLFAVCDGMGGEANGELASLAAVRALQLDEELSAEEEAMQNVAAANSAVNEVQNELNSFHTGTTLAAFSIDGTEGQAYNLGDSRVYLYRDGGLSQLTKDHTMASYLVELGILTTEQAEKSPNKNSLTSYLGINSENPAEPYFSERMDLREGDVVLLCSDGLYGMISEEQIREELSTCCPVEDIGKRLVRLALEAGGLDNVTAIVIRVEP